MSELHVINDLMDEDRFWELIEETLATATKASDDLEEQQEIQNEALAQALRKLSWQENLEFANRFDQVHAQAYRQDLWCAAYLMNGGCSDDGFIDFRRWVISRGRAVYEQALIDPDSLIDVSHPDPDYDYYAFEGFGSYTVADVFEELTGQELDSYQGKPYPEPDLEFTWDEDDNESMAAICPKLFAKHWAE